MEKYKAVPVNRYQEGREIDTESGTDPYHYGLVAGQPDSQPYYEAAIEISSEYGIPLAKFSDCAIDGAVSDDEDFWNGNMPEQQDLKRLEEALEEVDFAHSAEIEVGIREAAIEQARYESAPHEPSRLESVFACNTLDDALRYQAEHQGRRPGTHQHCTLEVIDQTASFDGDMHMLDRIDINRMDAEQVKELATRYWQGEHTHDPLLETHSQGKFRFGPAIMPT